MATPSKSRTHAFEAVRNFRDCGGYPARDGRTFRTGMLFRSGHFPLATDADLAKLRALEIATIVDLRREGERETFPCRRWDEFRARIVTRDGGREAELAPHLLVLRELGRTHEPAQSVMRRMYEHLPFEPMIIGLMRDFLAALAEADGPVLVHCAAGKDRTGLAVALAHHVTGVSGDDMRADYLLSNDAVVADAETLARVRERYASEGRSISDEAIRVVLSVAPEYLDAMLGVIDARYGSLDSYIDDVLAISRAQRAAIIERFTE